MNKTPITVIIEKTKTGFSAYANEIQDVIALGSTIDEIKVNFDEALKIHLEENSDLNHKKNVFKINYQYPTITSGDVAEAIKECLKNINGVDEVSLIMTDGIVIEKVGETFSLYTIQYFPEVRKQFTVTITDNRPD